MNKKLFSMFVSSLVLTVCLFWLSHGPRLEGLNQYTALSFFAGLLGGVLWGMSLATAFFWAGSQARRGET